MDRIEYSRRKLGEMPSTYVQLDLGQLTQMALAFCGEDDMMATLTHIGFFGNFNVMSFETPLSLWSLEGLNVEFSPGRH